MPIEKKKKTNFSISQSLKHICEQQTHTHHPMMVYNRGWEHLDCGLYKVHLVIWRGSANAIAGRT